LLGIEKGLYSRNFSKKWRTCKMRDVVHQCKSPLFQAKISGKIIKRYNKSCLVKITNYETIDEDMVMRLLGKIVLPNKAIKGKNE